MKAITLNIANANYVAVDDKTYFLNRRHNATQLLPTTCPHRGGPLHMGEITLDGKTVVCPWHDNKYKICNLEKNRCPPSASEALSALW
jgi:nitrite reductase/ring-hydroxylating ferredoxin subunit